MLARLAVQSRGRNQNIRRTNDNFAARRVFYSERGNQNSQHDHRTLMGTFMRTAYAAIAFNYISTISLRQKEWLI